MSETIIIVGVPTAYDAFLEVDEFLEELKRNDIPIVRVMKNNSYKVCTRNCTVLFLPMSNPDSIRGRKCHACFGFSEEEQCYMNFSRKPTGMKCSFVDYVIGIESGKLIRKKESTNDAGRTAEGSKEIGV